MGHFFILVRCFVLWEIFIYVSCVAQWDILLSLLDALYYGAFVFTWAMMYDGEFFLIFVRGFVLWDILIYDSYVV